MADFNTAEAGEAIGDFIWDAITVAQNTAPRTLQSANRILGMSQLGGCREYIRATIAGDPQDEDAQLRWAAYMGTAAGDKIESDLKRIYAPTVTQKRVTLFLNIDGTQISISGSTDIMFTEPVAPDLPPAVIDLKSKDGLAEVRRMGPSFKEKAQISGYLLAAIDEGVLPKDAIGTLVFFDRSGRDRTKHTWSIDYEQALLIMDAVIERLKQVASDLASGGRSPRDEPESWCFYVGCPFYNACWAGYKPTGAIEHPDEIAAIQVYVEGRRDAKEANDRMRSAKTRLEDVTGVTPDGTILDWTLQQNGTLRIDVREPKE